MIRLLIKIPYNRCYEKVPSSSLAFWEQLRSWPSMMIIIITTTTTTLVIKNNNFRILLIPGFLDLRDETTNNLSPLFLVGFPRLLPREELNL